MNKVKKLLWIIVRYGNWRVVVWAILRKREIRKVDLRNGISIFSSGDNTLWEMTEEIFFRNVYTPEGFEINNNDVVVDIGANVGVFTIFAAKRTKNTVFAYEPFFRNFEVLKKNTKGFKNVKCFCVGVSKREGKERLYHEADNTVGTLFNRNIHGELKNFVEVPTITLKKLFEVNKIKSIDFLKIDTEGSEGAILESTSSEYLKRIKKISLEFHDNVSSLKHNEIIKLLKGAGFVTKLNWEKGSAFGYIYGKRM